MIDKFMSGVFRVIEVLFFTGLAGCFLAIFVSWIEIFSDGFSKDE